MTPSDLRLTFAPPLLPDNLFGHLAATGVPGVEEWRDGAYRVTVRLAGGPAVLALSPRPDHVAARVWLSGDDLDEAVALCRFVLDLDADPATVDATLAADPVLAPLVAAAPGRRVPRIADASQFAIRAVIGQQVSTAAARTHAGRLVAAYGTAFEDPEGALTHLFPTPDDLAGLRAEDLAMPRSRQRTLLGLVAALREGLPVEEIGSLPGIGPWTVASVAMRALGDRDAFLPTDLGVAQAAARLGLPAKPRELTAYAERWRPYRAYAVQHLWATGDHAVNHLPSG
ncbi:DNA-3-methyladenine glycosylase 2 family protein [Nocardioides mangrovicus]|uniref:DNA-3-methyladenine glycosylase II n=1 Tax=Nocardioides mangrovicus TaxID=2478913 RepID=A0A3L8P495_9ACTN|nr:AlkA N-terminal domain-containing protein [Nocardioides mangrovicus]RLV50226.1 DNA-3-methyladenine glycosylase 2 family protein [Nocardioides mangrovicus]